MTLKEITIAFSDYSEYYIFLVGLISIVRYTINPFYKKLTWYCLILGFAYIFATALATNYINNWFMYHIIGLLELVFTYFLFTELGLKQKWSVIFLSAFILYLSNSIYIFIRDFQALKSNPLAEAYFVNDIGLAISLFMILLLGLNFLWKMYIEEQIEAIVEYSYFYIVGGFTVYAAGTFFIYLFSSSFMPIAVQSSVSYYSWILVAGFTYIKFTLIIIGLRFAKNGN